MAFVLIHEEKLNQGFHGHAESCLYEFTINLPDQFGASWTAKEHVQAHINELSGEGSILLEYRLWEDKLSGTWTTKYQCEIVASASPLWWNLIIFGVIAIMALIAVNFVIKNVKDIAQYAPGAIAWGAGAIIAVAAAVAVLALRRRST